MIVVIIPIGLYNIQRVGFFFPSKLIVLCAEKLRIELLLTVVSLLSRLIGV